MDGFGLREKYFGILKCVRSQERLSHHAEYISNLKGGIEQ
jgi:hypothetical protein